MEHVEHQGLSLVLVGNLNPAIFNPDWLCRQGIINEDEVNEAKIEVIHPELTQFTVGDLGFDISQERFAILALAEPFVRLADIVAEIFKVKLGHTPLRAMGINYYAHFRVKDWRQQTALGRRLAPIEPWGDWGKTLESGSLDGAGGLANLTMQQSKPTDRVNGNIKTIVQPSKKIEDGCGVYVQVNDHYEVAPDGTPIDFAELCLERITPSLERSRGIVTHLSTLARTL